MTKNYYYKKSNSSKSIRTNAFWTETANGIKYLVSYETIVACIDKVGKFHRFWNDYSATTMNHINKFCNLFGVSGYSKKEWESLNTESVDYNDYLSIKPLITPVKTSYY
jgi:hypothetical protein